MLMRELLQKLKDDPDYIYEGLKYDLSEQLYKLMKEKGITKKELAKKMGVSPAYVSKIFGADNISLRTVAKVLAALDAGDMTLKIVPLSTMTNKFGRLFTLPLTALTPYDLQIEEIEDETEEIGNAA